VPPAGSAEAGVGRETLLVHFQTEISAPFVTGIVTNS